MRRWFLALLAASAVWGFSSAAAEPVTLRVGGTGVALGGMKLLGAAYVAKHPDVQVVILPSLGSSGGVKALQAGAIEVAVSSRAFKPEEIEAGLIGRRYASTQLAVVTRPDTNVDALTIVELERIYAGGVTAWADGAPVRLVLRPDTETDTVLLRAMSPTMDAAIDSARARPGLLSATDDQENADLIESLPGALGLVAVGQIQTEARTLKVVPLMLDGAENAPEMRKDLYIATVAVATPHVMTFIDFVGSPEADAILEKHGHVAER